MNAKHALYLLDVTTLKPVQAIPEIPKDFRLRWSPDSKQLIFSGCIGLQLQCALWLYNSETKSLALIDKGDFQDFTWVTNQKVAAIKNVEETSFKDNQIWEYSISP